MVKDIKQTILDHSKELFVRQGYTKTSMRQIARACGITVGNLCYHFPKKEELLLAFHDELHGSSITHLPSNYEGLDPWCSYIATEYGFMYRCAFDRPIRKLYLDVINVPSLRRSYTEIHHEVFLRFFKDITFHCSAYELLISTSIASSIEYQLMEQFDALGTESETDFDHALYHVFEVRMHLLDIARDKRRGYIEKGFAVGKQIASEIMF